MPKRHFPPILCLIALLAGCAITGSIGQRQATPRSTAVSTAEFDVTVSPSGFVHCVAKGDYAADYRWDFGEDGQTFTHPVTGLPMRTGRDQTGPLAVYRVRTPGTYTVSLNGAAASFVYAPPAYTDQVFEPGPVEPAFDWVKSGNNRRAVLRRGGVYTASRVTTWNSGKSQHVVAEAGSGSLPIIRAVAPLARIIITNQRHVAGGETTDRLFENIAWDGGLQTGSGYFAWDDVSTSFDPAVVPVHEHVYFAGCTFTGFSQAISFQPKISARYNGVWGCTFDFRDDPCASMLFTEVEKNFFIIGSKFVGGNAVNKLKDHPLYLNCNSELLVRWNTIGPGKMGYGVNGNVPTTTPPTKADNWLFDGNAITGVSHGQDFGDGNNDPTQGLIDHVVIQNSKIILADVGPGGQASRAICLTCAKNITIHDNEIVGHDDLATDSSASVAVVKGYRNKVTVFRQSAPADPRLNNTTPPGPVVPPPLPPPPPPPPQPAPPPPPSTQPATFTVTNPDGSRLEIKIVPKP